MAQNGQFQRFKIAPNVRPNGRLELEVRSTIRFARMLRRELGSSSTLAWKERLRIWSLGFTAKSAVLYRLHETNPANYVPDMVYALRAYKINAFFNPIVGNKLVLSQVFAGHGVPHPKVLAALVRGRLVDVEGRLAASTTQALLQLAAESPRMVFRPHWSGAGEGVFFLRHGSEGWAINEVPASHAEVVELVSSLDRYIVSAFVEQATYAREIFPSSANTIRVLTLWDGDGDPFVASAVHRFGTSRSFPIDNWHQGRGGVCAAIDREAGTLGRAARLDGNGRLEWVSTHPETGAAIEGVRIPRLAETLAGIVRAARCFPEAPCVGWDALICDDGFTILEGNSPPGLYVWQVHDPLLAEERTARFFAARGIRRPGTSRSPW